LIVIRRLIASGHAPRGRPCARSYAWQSYLPGKRPDNARSVRARTLRPHPAEHESHATRVVKTVLLHVLSLPRMIRTGRRTEARKRGSSGTSRRPRRTVEAFRPYRARAIGTTEGDGRLSSSDRADGDRAIGSPRALGRNTLRITPVAPSLRAVSAGQGACSNPTTQGTLLGAPDAPATRRAGCARDTARRAVRALRPGCCLGARRMNGPTGSPQARDSSRFGPQGRPNRSPSGARRRFDR
jgi:hypothetical protein